MVASGQKALYRPRIVLVGICSAEIATKNAAVCPKLPQCPRDIRGLKEALLPVGGRFVFREAIHIDRDVDCFPCESVGKFAEPAAPILRRDASPAAAPGRL